MVSRICVLRPTATNGPNYRLEMHLDTNEANAAGLNTGDDGVLIDVKERAVLTTRKLPIQ